MASVDGWQLTASLFDGVINSVPNLAGDFLTREAFVSARGTGQISGNGAHKINSGALLAGYQIGCPRTLDGELALGLGSTGSLGSSGGGDGNVPTPTITPPTINNNVKVKLTPGSVDDVQLVKKSFKGQNASISMDGVHITMSGCGGPVTIRGYVTLNAGTAVSQDSVTVYGDPLRI
ncbi:MspA family porin [Rhodococcus sp. D2-41]|uniref:MspA family porin n=2 Tax=Speluncibacter jeojiensis TaxID=2710754 RepID=A0A9X4REH5_9ACTN|nr:MspA family porin [Rhodococcus sp. D2-41]MDG3012648.1 MspA family porin [Rhodococcus sp. D2-41]MDG3015247.1 MspA family porin [Corynebacteriales bacterium D3-21]